MHFQFSIEELKWIGNPRSVHGYFDGKISKITSLQEATCDTLSFLANSKYSYDVTSSKASLFLLPENCDFSPATDKVAFFCENPSGTLAEICSSVPVPASSKPFGGIAFLYLFLSFHFPMIMIPGL
jgi:UDP-3-O-[3-hydroxymyristoyl] glucosamine N-acyltransferase